MKISVYKIISVIAVIVLFFILILPSKYNVNKKQKTDECIRNMKTVYEAIEVYMSERGENFAGKAKDLHRMGYLKRSAFECPEKSVGDKYFMEGNYETGEITVKCPHSDKPEFKDHALPESLIE
jgi:competence protein ComGC